MEGEAISATIGVLVQNVIDVCKEERSMMKNFKKNASELGKTLATIQGYLDDAQNKFITEAAVKEWLKRLEDAAYDADTVLDELNYQLLSEKAQERKSGDVIKKKSCFPCSFDFDHYLRRRDMALKFKDINKRFEAANKDATGLGLHQKLAAAPAAPNAGQETDAFARDPIFIGRDGEVSKIVEMLTTQNEEAVSVFPIFGMGGLGKTTLARQVFNNGKIQTHFGKHIWVHVRDFDAVPLFKKILEAVGGSIEDVSSRHVLLAKIQVALEAKTYLLVLDDVWNLDQQKWVDFINSLSGITSIKGNGILVTTRSTEIGAIVQTLPDIPQLGNLSWGACWSIIKGKAFKGGEIPTEFGDLEPIGESIAKRCQGLPLAAFVVGGMLSGKSYGVWQSIEEKWLHDGVGGGEDDISKILKLSFYHLPSPSLKKCFAYCSIFPKGARIEREQLIELWMAEGFLQPSQTGDMETRGNKFLEALVQNSLLQVVDRDKFGDVKHCSMHDLVHDVAASALGISDKTCPARYTSWSEVREIRNIPKEQAKRLRTLNIGSCGSLFEYRNIPKELIPLRYLQINSSIYEAHSSLGNWIGELYHLQTLRVKLVVLPSTLTDLINLRHLHFPPQTELPPYLGRLTNLQTLPYFHVRDEDGHRIEELGSLKNLKGELEIDGLEYVQGEEESNKADLSGKSGIVKLALKWNGGRGGNFNVERVLNGLKPQQNLKMLEIDGFPGNSFPSWKGLSNLMEIRLRHCSKCEEIPTLGNLPCLKSLLLNDLPKVKFIDSSFYGEAISAFPALERLELCNMLNLTEWKEVKIPEWKVFPRLEYLIIYNCEQLTSICNTKLKTLRELKIEFFDELVCLPDWLFINNQHLSKLRIVGCPKLRELPDGLHGLNSMEELEIRICPNLKSIPYSINDRKLPLLRELVIDDVGDADSWNCPSFKKAVDGVLGLGSQSLRTLKLRAQNWDTFPDQLQHLTTLEALELECFGIEELPEWFGNLSSLRFLNLRDCKKLRRLPSVEAMRRLTKLHNIRISGCPLLKLRPIQQQSDADESEWPKISHLDDVSVDFVKWISKGKIEDWLMQVAKMITT
ncbi:hypothetical protein ACS0TY_025914 [Phlomoides rotata]